ncbi:MAG: molybdopterin converting factor subunit 1 [Rhodospirillales bacterium]|nr:molybdopterin converting factor subunit 1 [Rhodospirillales bacterium]
MHLLYFGWVRQKIGRAGEALEPPPGVADVAQLIAWLKTRGSGYAEALRDISALRVAVNQELAELGASVAQGDEIALFPPMTGG